MVGSVGVGSVGVGASGGAGGQPFIAQTEAPTPFIAPCNLGKFFMSEGGGASGQCLNCPAGKFGFDSANSTGVEGSAVTTSSCESCPAGQYQESAGMVTCASCPAGKYQPSDAASANSGGGTTAVAGGGTTAVAGGGTTVVAGEGTAVAAAGAAGGGSRHLVATGATRAACYECLGGKYQPSAGMSDCTSCTNGICWKNKDGTVDTGTVPRVASQSKDMIVISWKPPENVDSAADPQWAYRLQGFRYSGSTGPDLSAIKGGYDSYFPPVDGNAVDHIDGDHPCPRTDVNQTCGHGFTVPPMFLPASATIRMLMFTSILGQEYGVDFSSSAEPVNGSLSKADFVIDEIANTEAQESSWFFRVVLYNATQSEGDDIKLPGAVKSSGFSNGPAMGGSGTEVTAGPVLDSVVANPRQPEFVLNLESPATDVNPGDLLVLTAIIRARPRPTFAWTKDKAPFGPSFPLHNVTAEPMIQESKAYIVGEDTRYNVTLTFPSIHRLDTGSYQLRAVNYVGETQSARMQLDVECYVCADCAENSVSTPDNTQCECQASQWMTYTAVTKDTKVSIHETTSIEFDSSPVVSCVLLAVWYHLQPMHRGCPLLQGK
jgi:hypothetical protein